MTNYAETLDKYAELNKFLEKETVFLGIDVSGSGLGPELYPTVNKIARMLLNNITKRVIVFQADTQILNVRECTPQEKLLVTLWGGGGTDFRDVMKWVKEKSSNNCCCIFLTDLCVAYFGSDPGIPFTWIDITDSSIAEPVPFGKVIRIKDVF